MMFDEAREEMLMGYFVGIARTYDLISELTMQDRHFGLNSKSHTVLDSVRFDTRSQ